jgi:hypothetical protein
MFASLFSVILWAYSVNSVYPFKSLHREPLRSTEGHRDSERSDVIKFQYFKRENHLSKKLIFVDLILILFLTKILY